MTEQPRWEGERAVQDALVEIVAKETAREAAAAWSAAAGDLEDIEVPLPDVLALAVRRLEKSPADALDWRELIIAAGCGAGHRTALDHLDADYIERARPAVTALGLDPSTVDEVLQRARTTLVVPKSEGDRARICDYAGQGELKSLVRVVAVREGLGFIRKQKRERASGDDRLFEKHGVGLDPELVGIEQQHRAALKEAFEEAVGQLTSRQRNLLRMQTLEGLPVEQMAQLYQVHRVTVSRWLQDAREAVAEGTKRHLRRELQLDTRGMASLIRVVQSRVDMSLERILATQSPELEHERRVEDG
jgi:RNA polymerase sigma-70 factor (ECF subfamily)